jgi:hypothetical protein
VATAEMSCSGLDALLTPEESVLLLVDHQGFQFANLHSHAPQLVVNNVIALAKTAKVFGVPTILTTVLEERGGHIIKGIQDVFPDQKSINRSFINAWQGKRFVEAVKKTGRKTSCRRRQVTWRVSGRDFSAGRCCLQQGIACFTRMAIKRRSDTMTSMATRIALAAGLAAGLAVAALSSPAFAKDRYECMTDDGYGRKRSCSASYKAEHPNWRGSDDCYTDDGYGRKRSCSAAYKAKHAK